tara:strand:- start:801 stop:1031 length:231 start_codon:yes stop_codon:yes gene_type:complete
MANTHTITNINNLTVKIIDTDINSIPTNGQTAHRTSGSFALAVAGPNRDDIISEHIIRRKGNNKCQLLIIYENNTP